MGANGTSSSSPRALVLVDLQAGFVEEDPGLRAVAERAAEHAQERGDDYVIVAASRFRNEPGSAYWRLVGHDMVDEDEVALVPAVAALDAFVVDTPTYSSATPELVQRLRDLGVVEVHVCGVDTDQCVLATVFGLFDAGFEPVVLEDLVQSASGLACHDAGIIALHRAIGEDRVRPSRQALDTSGTVSE